MTNPTNPTEDQILKMSRGAVGAVLSVYPDGGWSEAQLSAFLRRNLEEALAAEPLMQDTGLPSDDDAPDVTIADIWQMTLLELDTLSERKDLSIRQRIAIGQAAFNAKSPEDLMSESELHNYLHRLGLTTTSDDEVTQVIPVITDDIARFAV